MYMYTNSIYIYDYICICYHLITGMNHVSTMDNKIRHCNDSICASHFFFNHVMCCCSLYGDFFQVGDHQKDGFQFQYQAMVIHNLDNFGYPYDFGCSPHIPTATKYRWKMLEKETHQIDNFKSPQNSRTHQFEPSNICCMRPPTLDSTSQNKTDHSPSCAKGLNELPLRGVVIPWS